MNGRSLFLASAAGALAGLVFSLLLGKADFSLSCIANGFVIAAATFIAAMFAPMVYNRIPTTGMSALQGALHGVCTAGLATIVTWVVISLATTDATIEQRTLQWIDSMEKMLEMGGKSFGEDQREETQKQIQEMRDTLPGNPQMVRWIVLGGMLFFAFIAAPLIGAFAGWIGLSTFRHRLEQRVGEPQEPKEWWNE